MSSRVLAIALEYCAAGLSILPIATDGSKGPPLGFKWSHLQERRLTELEVTEIFGNGANVGIGIIGGAVSGNVEVPDIDDAASGEKWDELVKLSGGAELISKLPLVQTPSGGSHVYYRCSTIEGNKKLALRQLENKKTKVLIETRGEGGYVLAPGSPGECHPTGRLYTLKRGDLTQIPEITVAERDLLLSCARQLNEYITPADVVSGNGHIRKERTGNLPGDQFNERATWDEILTPHGWTLAGGNKWHKPGDTGRGHHATTDHAGRVLFYCFSTAAWPFEGGKAYSKFSVYTLLNHNGDYSAAARALYKAGYGDESQSVQEPRDSKLKYVAETPAWEEDRSLYRELPPPERFPMDALGDLLEPAVKKCQEVIQAPDAICAGSFLAGLNLAIQPHADIEIDGYRVMPVSEYFIEAAESGDRKTATDHVALAPHEAWQQVEQEKYKKEYGYYKAADEVYQAERERIIKNKQLNDQQRRQQLDELKESGEPLYPLITCSEPTYEGLAKQLANGYPSTGLFSNEGGRFLGGHAMNRDNVLKTAAGLSGLWDTGKFDRVRAADGASAHYGKRLSLHLLIQPDLAQLLFGNRLLVGQGIISRILPAAPLRTEKQYKAVDLSKDPAIITYSNRITELLNLPLPLRTSTRNTLEPPHLTLSPRTNNAYHKFHDVIQSKLGDGKQLASIRGFGNKAHDHALRIAATLACGSDVQVRIIHLEDFERSLRIVTFAMSELMRIIDASTVSNSLLDAQRLLDWLLTRGERYFCLREVYQRGPGNIRHASKGRQLLDILQEHGKVRPTMERIEYGGQISPAWEVRAFAAGAT